MYNYPRRFGASCITAALSALFSNNPTPITIEMYLNISVVKGGSYEYMTTRMPVV